MTALTDMVRNNNQQQQQQQQQHQDCGVGPRSPYNNLKHFSLKNTTTTTTTSSSTKTLADSPSFNNNNNNSKDTLSELPNKTDMMMNRRRSSVATPEGKLRSRIGSKHSSSMLSIVDDMALEDSALPISRRSAVEKRTWKPVAVDKYKFLSYLGRGGCAHVKKARDISTNEVLAVKVIKEKEGGDGKVRYTFKELMDKTDHEVSCLAQVQGHPNILTLKDYVATDRKLFVVTEFANKGDLFDHVVRRESVMPEVEAKHLFRQLMSAVAHMHRRGVGHRDIKPENILLSEEGSSHQTTIKLCDFGFAVKWKEGDQTVPGTMGTVRCLAPEMIRRHSWRNPVHNPFAADIWSCGVVLFFLLTGCFPFEAETDNETLRNTVDGRVVGKMSKKSFTPELKDLLGKIFQREANLRPSANDILDHPFLTQDAK